MSRIIAVSDTYDALIAERPYKASCNSAQALAIIEAETPAKYDRRVVAALRSILEPLIN